jgi:hypothetical protein
MTTLKVGDNVRVNATCEDAEQYGREGKVVTIDTLPWPIGVEFDSELPISPVLQFDPSELDLLDENYPAGLTC